MSDQEKPGWKFTAKLPLLIVGLVLILGGWFWSLRGGMKALVGGGALMAAGLAAIIWSSSIHNWCVPNEQKWGMVPFERMRFHDGPPSLRDCLALVGVTAPVKSMTFREVEERHRPNP